MIRRSTFFGIAAVAALSLVPVHAEAAPPTKDECVEAHSKGQDLREAGQLAESKRLFLICGQQSCPALVQSDCAKFGEELSRTVPSVSFSARDAKGADLSDTQVFVDGKLIAPKLDGSAYDVDPGKHEVKFVHAGETVIVNLVAAVGEKGRAVGATFGDKSEGTPTAPVQSGATQSTTTVSNTSRPPESSRSALPLVVAGVGGAAVITGVVLGLVGIGKVPGNCDRSTNTCKAAPGDKSFDDASSGVKLANIGIGVGIGGAVVLVGGLVWYFVSPKTPSSTSSARISPALGGHGGDLSFSF